MLYSGLVRDYGFGNVFASTKKMKCFGATFYTSGTNLPEMVFSLALFLSPLSPYNSQSQLPTKKNLDAFHQELPCYR